MVEYEYGANGNMTRDLNRNIVAVKYNSLGLPAAIAFNNKALGGIKHTSEKP